MAAAREGGGGWRLETYEQLPSTSDLCAARARAGESEGLAVMAGQQTSGRGRGQRVWLSPPGNLALSVLLRPQTPLAIAGQWALLAGVALFDALASVAPALAAELRLKWPNDVTLAGAKLAGILIESATDAAGRSDWMVFGFGVNLVAAPTLPDRRTVALAERMAPPAPAILAAAILDGLASWRAVLQQGGFARLREAWLGYAHPPGTGLSVACGDARCHGYFAGLDEAGALLLATEDGIRKFQTGEVVLDAATRSDGQT
ncbi:biotin--[acetyl-CoA-carboxylase] ligase [Acidibrevibacterium fodinaquatile]|uniref:biotin--[acetyl-CoA-carboxylase] ligase n=1 Tax=Acidibrevibacterium fodinaquatile TaxID=1969806 RepID=UPI000E0CC4A3|nr:biotin--[acetyl-CoA-carboxylase] ligase [Acidibrevibacterium fodinaquatile]